MKGNLGNVVLNNSMTNEAMPVHINSTEEEAAVHMNQNTKLEIKAALTLVVGIRKSKRYTALNVTLYPLSPHATYHSTSFYVKLKKITPCVCFHVNTNKCKVLLECVIHRQGACSKCVHVCMCVCVFAHTCSMCQRK